MTAARDLIARWRQLAIEAWDDHEALAYRSCADDLQAVLDTEGDQPQTPIPYDTEHEGTIAWLRGAGYIDAANALAYLHAEDKALRSGRRLREVLAEGDASPVRPSSDRCPKCGGQFTTTGGYPAEAPFICQRCWQALPDPPVQPTYRFCTACGGSGYYHVEGEPDVRGCTKCMDGVVADPPVQP